MKEQTDYINVLKNTLHKEKIRSPLSASIDITSKCNLSCAHCYNKSRHAIDYINSLEIVKDIVDKLDKMHILELTICGGEPLTSHLFLDMIKEIKKTNISIYIITNGVYIDECCKELEKLLTENDCIQVSVDESLTSSNWQRYNNIDQKKRVYDNLRKISSVFENLLVNITPTSMNQNEIIELVKEVSDCGVKKVGATPYIPIGGNKADRITPDYAFLKEAEEKVISYCENNHIKYYGGIAGHICQQKIWDKADSKNKMTSDKRYCDAGNYSFHISNDGKIYPCAFMQQDDLVISDIRLSSEMIIEDFKKYAKLDNIDYPSKCRQCKRLSKCFGGCMGLIYDRYGSLNQVDPRCVV